MPDTERFNQVTGLILLHPLTITFLLLTTSYPAHQSIPTSYWFIILSSFILSIIFFLLQHWINERPLLYMIFLSDIPLIGVTIHFTDGIEGMFPILYMVLVIVTASFLFRKGAYIISLISVLFFLALIIFESKRLSITVNYLMTRFYLFALLFLFTAILSGSLSERYKVRTEEFRRLRLTTEEIIKNLPSGIITIDLHGDVVYTNVADENIRSVVHLYLAKFLRNPEKVAKTTELEIGRRHYLLSCVCIGNVQGALGVLQDLTDFRRLEETSRISKQTKMLAELGGSLAHEIRNPLSSIRGSLEVISKASKKENINRFIGMALKESIRLNEIVTDFLNFAQFVPKKMNRVKINEVITEAILDIEQRFADKKIQLTREGSDFACRADLTRLKSGIANILSNAYEVSSNGQKIHIKTATQGKIGWIEITDQGPGIAKKDIKHVFVPFYTTKKGGTGLGLAIAQKIIEAHNGHVEVSSKINAGATFKIILPLA